MREGRKVILKGIAASAGQAIGKVKIINSPLDVGKMEKGGVVPETNPQYATAILQAVAIYKPLIILSIIIVEIAIWAFQSGTATKAGMPSIELLSTILLLIVGLLAGLLGGLIGTGGCSIMLPVIHFWMGYSAPIAVGTTLFAVIFTAISGGYGHLIRKNLDKRATFWLGSFGTLGVLLGSWIFTLLLPHAKLLGLILGLAFILPAVRMIWEGAKRTEMPKEGDSTPGHKFGFSLFGFIIGILTGVVGLGGGYALVPGLIYLFKAPVYITMGTSLAVMIPLAVVGGYIKLIQGFVALDAGLILALGTIVGAQIGAAIIKRFKPTTLKLIFGIYFFYVSLKFITGYFGVMIW